MLVRRHRRAVDRKRAADNTLSIRRHRYAIDWASAAFANLRRAEVVEDCAEAQPSSVASARRTRRVPKALPPPLTGAKACAHDPVLRLVTG
jgi:hypothetical protein